MAQIRHTVKAICEHRPGPEPSGSWIDTTGRVWGWSRDTDRRPMWFALQYRALLPELRAWRDEYSAYADATQHELAALARWLQEQDPLPRWLARVGYRRFLRHLLHDEPSETAIFLLAHRHRYSPHTVRRYITRFTQWHRLISLIAYGAEYVPDDSSDDGSDFFRECLQAAVARLKPHAAQLPRAWAETYRDAIEALNSDAPDFLR